MNYSELATARKNHHQQATIFMKLRRAQLSTSSLLRYEQSDKQQPNKEYKTILLHRPEKHLAHVELNRPKAKNAFGFESASELADVLRYLEDEPTVRCLILSGSGPDLTSGVDIKSFMTVYAQLQEIVDVGRKAKVLRRVIEQFQLPFKQMHAFSKPIICVQHGLTYGLGMELAACSDIRYCSKDVKLSIREVLIGIAADVGSLQLMPRLVSNQSLLRELIYTGRDLSPEEAVNLGFVSRICDTKQLAIDEAFKTARLIASRSPVAVQGSKQNMKFSGENSFHSGLDYNAIWNMSMMQSGDITKAIEAILSRSKSVEYEDF